MLTSPKRTATQAGTPGAPPHPTPPSKSVRPKRGRPAGPQPPRLPAGLLKQPKYPAPDATLKAHLSGLSDDVTKITAASNYIMHAVAVGTPDDRIEQHVHVSLGALFGRLLADRALCMRYCNALVAKAENFDRRAQELLAAVAGGAVRTPSVRAVLDFSNTLRCMAEGARRNSEATLRRGVLSAEREEARERARIRGLWSAVVGADKAYLPGIDIVLSPTTNDPLTAAQAILPQLEAEMAARKANSEDTIDLSIQAGWCRKFIKRKSQPIQPKPAPHDVAQDILAAGSSGDAPSSKFDVDQRGEPQMTDP